MERPKKSSALVVSCCASKSAKDLVDDITGRDAKLDRVENDIAFYEWTISTKYYDAVVDFCAPQHRTVPSSEFAETVEAVVIYFNPRERETFSATQLWLRTIEDLYAADVKVLICDSCQPDDAVNKEELDLFCIGNHLELIQLAPTELDGDEEEFGTIHGVSRVRGALYAHSWSNLTMKPKAKPFRYPPNHGIESADTNDTGKEAEEPESVSSDSDEEGGAAAVGDAFGDLFSRLHEFRSAASALNANDRKDFAEKVAKDFLRSLDPDDPDELSD